jgi:hypothetical protein
MAISERRKWSQLMSSPFLIVLVLVWIAVSFMLWKSWKEGAPWPLGMAMPF